MTLQDGDRQFDALLTDALRSRPTPQPVPGLARVAIARARPRAATTATRDLVINALVGIIIVAMVVTIAIVNPFAWSAGQTDAQSLSDDEIILFIVAAAIGMGVLLAVESCLRTQRSFVPQVRFSTGTSAT